LNGQKITVSSKASLDGAYVDQELWVNEVEGVSFDDPRDVLAKSGAKVTVMCSCAITGGLVAQGTYDAVLFGQGKPEDIAALSVIVTEAGGKVTDLLGRPQRYDRPIYGAVVSNGRLHDALVAVTSKMNYVSKNVEVENG
jgi:fructose-1,6-bisphosphatase/inositol monophosphatase family enzyme